MKRKTAKEILAQSFHELAAIKPIDKITIREITDNCGYSPATFYRQFKDKYDLIAWDYTRDIENILSSMNGGFTDWKQMLETASVYYEKHKKYLSNLLIHTGGYDSFVRYMTEIHFNSFKRTVIASSKSQDLDEKTEMYIRIYILGSVNLTCEWILGKYEASPQNLAEIYENSMPVPLRQFLL